VSVEAIAKDETVWLTQKGMAELFGVQTPAISKHLKNIFEESELNEAVVISKMERTTSTKGTVPFVSEQKEPSPSFALSTLSTATGMCRRIG